MSVEISVCISTWCRKDHLSRIVDALQNQSLSPDRYEVIVCDSHSHDGTADLMEVLCREHSNIRYLNTDKNVLSAKRNMGICAAASPIIVLIDDDVHPTEDFLMAHLRAHKSADNIVYCGQVRFPNDWVRSTNYYRFRDSCHLGDKHKSIHADLPFNKIVAMNLSFKKDEILSKVGLFSEDFIGYGGEDIEFGYRVAAAGMKLAYLEDALAYHYETSSLSAYGDKFFRSGRDGARTLNAINPAILMGTNVAYLQENDTGLDLKRRVKSLVYRLAMNKWMANLVKTFLDRTDGIRLLYCEIAYRYYLGCRLREGILAQGDINLTVDDVRHGWYTK